MRRYTRISNQPGVDYNDDCNKETCSTSIITVVMAEVTKNIYSPMKQTSMGKLSELSKENQKRAVDAITKIPICLVVNVVIVHTITITATDVIATTGCVAATFVDDMF